MCLTRGEWDKFVQRVVIWCTVQNERNVKVYECPSCSMKESDSHQYMTTCACKVLQTWGQDSSTCGSPALHSPKTAQGVSFQPYPSSWCPTTCCLSLSPSLSSLWTWHSMAAYCKVIHLLFCCLCSPPEYKPKRPMTCLSWTVLCLLPWKAPGRINAQWTIPDPLECLAVDMTFVSSYDTEGVTKGALTMLCVQYLIIMEYSFAPCVSHV